LIARTQAVLPLRAIPAAARIEVGRGLRRAAFVPVVQTTEVGNRDDRAVPGGATGRETQ